MTDHTVSFPYRPGDLVMAQFEGFSAWPAVVIANCHTSDRNIRDLRKHRHAGKKYAYVLFMRDRNFGVCDPDHLKELTHEKAAKLYKAEKKKKKMKEAFRDAMNYKDYWSLLLEANLVDPNEEKYVLKSIYDLPPGGAKRRIPADSLPSEEEDGEEDDDNDEQEVEEDVKVQAKKTPKTTKMARKSPTSASSAAPASKRRKAATPKLKAEDEADSSIVTKEEKEEEELDTPEALEKKAYSFRVHLQKGLVQKNRMPTEEEMAEANKYFEELEKFSPKVTKELLKKYKLHKVLKVIGRTDQLEANAPHYKFRERSQRLVLDWDPMLNELANEKARDTPNTTIDGNTSAIKSDTADTTHDEKNGTASVKPEDKAGTKVKEQPDHKEDEAHETTNGESTAKEEDNKPSHSSTETASHQEKVATP